ncbi:MAG: VWA domain-containing protein [Alphaproteobacteria bacterium]|nr:VWA domain-containing protein [Alphaproteobacteria bacterium]
MDTTKMVRRLAKQNEQKLSDKDIYLSADFKKYLSNYVESLLFRIRKKPKLNIIYDTTPNAHVAYTDNDSILLNAGNNISNFYNNPESRLIATIGITTHECAHILYMDFEGEKGVMEALKDGNITGEFAIEDDISDEIIETIKKKQFYPLFQQIYHHIANIFSDVHDEGKLSDEFHGFPEKSLVYSAEGMRMQSISLDSYVKKYEEQPNPLVALQIMYSCILQYARYREFIINDEDAIKEKEFYNKVVELKPTIELGCSTDDLYEKFSCINDCIYVLWEYIIATLQQDNEDENSDASSSQGGNGSGDGQQSSSSASNESSDNQNSDGQGNNNSSSDKSEPSGSDNKKEDNSQSSDSSGNKSENGGKEDDTKKNSSLDNISQDAIQNVMDALNEMSKGMNSETPDRDKTENNQSKSEENENTINNTTPMDDNTASNIAKNIMNQLKKNIANSQAENEVEMQIKQETDGVIKTIDMTSTHKNIPLHNIRELNVTDSDIREYNRIMGPLKGISKSMQKRMLAVLRDLKEGDVLKHRTFGSKLEARDAYRLDSKVFSKKKLPQDLPDMAICVLVDESGSMYGARIEAAKQATMLLHDFACGLNIPICILGHTEYGYFELHRYTEFESVNNKDKYRLAKITNRMNNRDGMGILIASELLSRRTEQVKLLIVISDGRPNGINYGGRSAIKDMQDIVKKYKKKGIQTFAAAIGNDKDVIKSIYGDGFLDISDLSKLPKAMVNLVKKRII